MISDIGLLFWATLYMDFEKAFDTVPHKRLISKLSSYSVNSKLIKWVKAFLNDRHFRVRVNGEFSSWFAYSCGISQGSILGPLLFIIYLTTCRRYEIVYSPWYTFMQMIPKCTGVLTIVKTVICYSHILIK